jgi:hypothetical protein
MEFVLSIYNNSMPEKCPIALPGEKPTGTGGYSNG